MSTTPLLADFLFSTFNPSLLPGAEETRDYAYGILYFHIKEWSTAEKYFIKVLSSTCENHFLYRIHLLLKALYSRTNRIDFVQKEEESLKIIAEKIDPTKFPDSWEDSDLKLFHFQKGLFYYENGNYDEAIKNFAEAKAKSGQGISTTLIYFCSLIAIELLRGFPNSISLLKQVPPAENAVEFDIQEKVFHRRNAFLTRQYNQTIDAFGNKNYYLSLVLCLPLLEHIPLNLKVQNQSLLSSWMLYDTEQMEKKAFLGLEKVNSSSETRWIYWYNCCAFSFFSLEPNSPKFSALGDRVKELVESKVSDYLIGHAWNLRGCVARFAKRPDLAKFSFEKAGPYFGKDEIMGRVLEGNVKLCEKHLSFELLTDGTIYIPMREGMKTAKKPTIFALHEDMWLAVPQLKIKARKYSTPKS